MAEWIMFPFRDLEADGKGGSQTLWVFITAHMQGGKNLRNQKECTEEEAGGIGP